MITAVITGGSRGIGYGLAKEFLAHDCNVIICGRNINRLEKAIDELGDIFDPDHILGIPTDMVNYEAVQSLWDLGIEKFGQIDIWVNNAGTTTIPVNFAEVPPEQIERVIGTNVIGKLNGMHVAMRGMLKQENGGKIYNIEGMGSRGDVQKGTIVLGASNSAITYMLKGLSEEYEGSKVQICNVRPGINVTEHLLHGVEHLSKERWEQTKRIFNILGDTPETTSPYLVEEMLKEHKSGSKIAWMSGMKIMKRFMLSPFNKRDLFENFEEPVFKDEVNK